MGTVGIRRLVPVSGSASRPSLMEVNAATSPDLPTFPTIKMTIEEAEKAAALCRNMADDYGVLARAMRAAENAKAK